MNVAEEVIFWVASDLANQVEPPDTPSAIPVALINQTDEVIVPAEVEPMQLDDVFVEEEALPKEKKQRKRGLVWSFFVPTVEDRARCSFCSVDISYKGKSTNNLLRHLRTKHSEITKLEMAGPKVQSCTTEDGSTFYVLTASDPSAQTNTSFNEGMTRSKKRGGVWQFFNSDSDKRASCTLCSTVISFKGGSTTNLLRHMKSKHPGIIVPHRASKQNASVRDEDLFDSRPSIQHSFSEIVKECIKSDDEGDYHSASQMNFDGDDNEFDDVEDIITMSSVDPNYSQNIESQNVVSEPIYERKKSAIAWKYFELDVNERARCNTCEALISFKGGSTGNLLRHLKTKHAELDLSSPVKNEEPDPEEEVEDACFETFENEELAKFVQMLNPKYKLRTASVPRLNEKEVPKRLRKRGAALSYFSFTSENCGTCQLCGALVNLRHGSKASLLRHLKAKHPETDSFLVSPNASGDSTSVDVTVPEQTLDNENIENIPIDENVTPKEKGIRKMRKRGLVWNHFAPLEDERAKCIACPAVISYKRGSTSNLLRHMKKKHPEIDVHDESYIKDDSVDEETSSEGESDGVNSSTVEGKPVRCVLRKRGRVWNYFRPVARDRAKCTICKQVVVYLRSSTTNLLRHVKKRHPNVDLAKEKPFNKRLRLRVDASNPAAKRGPSLADGAPTTVCTRSRDRRASGEWHIGEAAHLTTAKTASGSTAAAEPGSDDGGAEKVNAIYRRSEILFRKHFDKFLSRPVSVTKSKLFDEQLAKMIVKQYCPFTIVESDEFRKFVQTVNPGYSLPSRKTISSRLVPELHEKCVERVRHHLGDVRHVTLTTNGWTLANNERYIAITAHFIDEQCAYHSYLLDCFAYDKQHSPETLGDSIVAILTEWEVAHKVNAVVSDNTANVTAAIRLRGWRHIPCFANMLNLVVHTGLLELGPTLEKVRIIVDYFKKNVAAARKFATALQEAGLAETKLRPDDAARWETTIEMFRQLLAAQPALVGLDHYVETLPMLSNQEWLLLEKTCSTLKPFLDITNEVSERNITISKVIPLSRCIGNYLKKLLAAEDHLPNELNLMVNQMLDEITLRFSDVEDNALLAEATFLDPRFKNQAFVNEHSYANTYHAVLQMASNAVVPTSVAAEGGAAAPENATNAGAVAAAAAATSSSFVSCDIWAEFDSKVNQLADAQLPEMAAATEIENYLQETLLSRSADPLAWWKERRSLYPRLYDVMKQRLCIAATAVSKSFTSSGQLVCEKRNKLSSSKVSMVLFLNHNL